MSSPPKPTNNEDEFIVKQESLSRHKAALEKGKQLAASDLEARRKEHWMKCPKCGMDLETSVFRGVSIDRCYHCHGTWLDAGELELLAGDGQDLVSRIISVFKPDSGA